MNYVTLKAEQFPDFVQEFMKDPHPCYLNLLMREDDKILIARGRNDLGDLPDKFIPVETNHRGGAIVGFPDSVCLVAFYHDGNKPTWREDLTQFLISKGLNAKKTRNDITVDGFKVSGYSAQYIGKEGLVYATFFVAFNVNLEDINAVCKKKIVKVPKGLDEYGISRQEVLDALHVE